MAGEIVPFEVRILQLANGHEPFIEWRNSLDLALRVAVTRRIERLAVGNLGDHKALGDGLFELRLDIGPGLRVYCGREGRRVIILLAGGDKSTQARDILNARRYWKEYGQHKSV
jgi:putative addiction module killer protein